MTHTFETSDGVEVASASGLGNSSGTLRDELAVVSAVITGSTVIAKRSDHMTPLTERRAGWVLKPLHD